MKLEGLSDKHIAILVKVAKTNKGLRAFFGDPRGMIALRQEAYLRGIFPTEGDRMEAEKAIGAVYSALERRSARAVR